MFPRTCFKARCRLARSNTWASNAWVGIESGFPGNPAASSSCGCAAACRGRWSDAIPSLFTVVLSLSSFGPSAGAARLICPLLTTGRHQPASLICRRPTRWTPQAALLHGIQRLLPAVQLRFSEAPGRPPRVRHVTFLYSRRIYKMHPTADGGLCGHVPTRPGCITPHIRFLFIAPQFRIGLPSDPASRRRPCPSPCLRLCENLAIGLSPTK